MLPGNHFFISKNWSACNPLDQVGWNEGKDEAGMKDLGWVVAWSKMGPADSIAVLADGRVDPGLTVGMVPAKENVTMYEVLLGLGRPPVLEEKTKSGSYMYLTELLDTK